MIRSWWSWWWSFLLWFTMLWFSLTTCSKSAKKVYELESIGRDAYVAWLRYNPVVCLAVLRKFTNSLKKNSSRLRFELAAWIQRRILPHRTFRCINDYDNNSINRNSNNKMSHLYFCRLGYDTWCSLVGGILPFGPHTDPVFRVKLPTKLSATRCEN